MRATRERWTTLCQKIGAKDNPVTERTVNGAFEKIHTAYTEAGRYYHDINHINDGLEKLDEIRHLAEDPDALEMAWWWHDIIYDTHSHLNEVESAAIADNTLKNLGLQLEFRIKIMQLIFSTKHNHIPDNQDLRLIIDIDLASLAAPPKVFDQHTANIRKEYSWVPDNAFRTGRAEFFQKLMKGRPSIYLTEYFRTRYEAQAQENLKRAMAVLDN